MGMVVGFSILLYVFLIRESASETTKLLLVLEENSTVTLTNLWSSTGYHNDPSQSRQNMDLEAALKDGDYRSADLDNWSSDTPSELLVGAYNTLGKPLWTIRFNCTGIPFGLTWTSETYYIRSWPISLSLSSVDIYLFLDDFNMRSTTYTTSSWLLHSMQDNAVLTLFSRDGQPHPLLKSSPNPFSNIGCYHFSRFIGLVHVGTDTNWMTWQLCRGMCSSKNLILLTAGTKCYCADSFASEVSLDDAECSLKCAGNVNQACGGSEGIHTAITYSATMSTYNSGSVGSYTWSVGSMTLPHITKVSSSQLNSGSTNPVYINGIRVHLTVSSTVKFRLYYHIDQCTSSLTTSDMTAYAVNGDVIEFTASSDKSNIETTVFGCIWIELYSSLVSSTTDIASIFGFYYSDDDLLRAPYFVIHGIYESAVQSTPTSSEGESSVSTAQSTSDITTAKTTESQQITTTDTEQFTTNKVQSTSEQIMSQSTSNQQAISSEALSTGLQTQSVTSQSTTTSIQQQTTVASESASASIQQQTNVTSESTSAIIQQQTTVSLEFTTSNNQQQTTLSQSTAVSVQQQTVTTCLCRCLYLPPEQSKYQNMTQEEIEEEIKEEIQKIKQELTVSKSNLSSEIRKKTSAEDNRPSSMSIGGVGIVILSFVLGFLVIFDLMAVVTYLSKGCTKMFGRNDK